MASDTDGTDTGAAPLTINAPPGPTGSGGPAPALMISPDDYDALVRTTIGEAGGEPDIGKVAVVHNILNRVVSGKYPSTVMGVVTQPGQYESVNTRGAQLAAIPTDSQQYQNAARAVSMAISGQAPDPTGNALNFYAPQLQSDLGRAAPAWAKGPSVQIGRHVFYNGSGGQPPRAAVPSAVVASAPAAGGGGAAGASGDLSDDDLDAMLSGRTSGAAGGGGSRGAGGAAAAASPLGGAGGAPASAAPTSVGIQGQGGGAQGVGAPAAGPVVAGQGAAAAGGLSDGDIAGMLSGRSGTAGSGGALSDDDMDAMLSGRAPGFSAAGSTPAGGAGSVGTLTIHGAGASPQAPALTPTSGAFGSLNRGAFGAAAADASAATAQPPATSPSDISAATDDADLKARFAAAAAKGRANLAALPDNALHMAAEVGSGVPMLGAAVNPLAARLASAFTGQSVDDATATGNALGARFETDHPGLTMASRFAGGAAAMGPLVEAAPWAFGLNKGGTLAGRMLASGATNALLAAGDSVARGEDPTSGGYIGNALRYAPGFLAPGVGAAASGLTKGIGNALGAVADRGANLLTTQTASGVKGYGTSAVDYLLNKIAADGGANALGAKLSDLGSEGMIADTGPNVRGQAATLATKPGEAKAVVQDAVSDRHDGRTTRILSDVDSALGPAQNPTPVRQAIEDTAAHVTDPLFARAYAAGTPWTPELDALAQRPAIRSALTEASTAAENRGAPLPTVTLDAGGNPVASTAPLAAYEAGQRPAVTAALADALGSIPRPGRSRSATGSRRGAALGGRRSTLSGIPLDAGPYDPGAAGRPQPPQHARRAVAGGAESGRPGPEHLRAGAACRDARAHHGRCGGARHPRSLRGSGAGARHAGACGDRPLGRRRRLARQRHAAAPHGPGADVARLVPAARRRCAGCGRRSARQRLRPLPWPHPRRRHDARSGPRGGGRSRLPRRRHGRGDEGHHAERPPRPAGRPSVLLGP